MATNDKVRVSTLDDWYLALSKMYNNLKTENQIRYNKDVGKDYVPSSKLNSGAKATVEHISHVVNGINALNGKDLEGNIPTDKDDLKVYFWYSDWNTPPGEIQVGDAKIKIRSQLKNEIDGSISELKQICVNNSKDKVLMCQYDADHSYDKSVCNDYNCPEHDCVDTTVPNVTIPSDSRTVYSTAYNSINIGYVEDTITRSNSQVPNPTIVEKTKNSITTLYADKCKNNSKTNDSQKPYNINCNQVVAPGCKADITNNKYYTDGQSIGYTERCLTTNSKCTDNSKTESFSKELVTYNSIKPDNSDEVIETLNGTYTYFGNTPYGTVARNSITPNATELSYTQDLSNTDNVRRIQSCNKCAPDCSQDIRCQTYNIGYSVKANEDGTYKTFVCSDTINLDKYLYIK